MRNPLPYFKQQWQAMTPGQKALSVTTTLVVTAINPLYPLVYASVYGVAAARRKDEDECSDN